MRFPWGLPDLLRTRGRPRPAYPRGRRGLLVRGRYVGAAEDQPARVPVDVLEGALDLRERTPSVGREPLPFAQSVGGEAREPARDLRGARVEVLGRRPDGARGLAEVARRVRAAHQAL